MNRYSELYMSYWLRYWTSQINKKWYFLYRLVSLLTHIHWTVSLINCLTHYLLCFEWKSTHNFDNNSFSCKLLLYCEKWYTYIIYNKQMPWQKYMDKKTLLKYLSKCVFSLVGRCLKHPLLLQSTILQKPVNLYAVPWLLPLIYPSRANSPLNIFFLLIIVWK